MIKLGFVFNCTYVNVKKGVSYFSNLGGSILAKFRKTDNVLNLGFLRN